MVRSLGLTDLGEKSIDIHTYIKFYGYYGTYKWSDIRDDGEGIDSRVKNWGLLRDNIASSGDFGFRAKEFEVTFHNAPVDNRRFDEDISQHDIGNKAEVYIVINADEALLPRLSTAPYWKVCGPGLEVVKSKVPEYVRYIPSLTYQVSATPAPPSEEEMVALVLDVT